jgi:HlyD family secretion protein
MSENQEYKPKRHWRRLVGGGVIGLVVVAGLTYALRKQPLPVDLATVERGPLAVTIEAEGRTRVADVYVVSAPVIGRMQRIEARAGDRVVAGETVLASIRPTAAAFLDVRSRRQAESVVRTARAATNLARASRDRARAELDYAQNELKRAEALARKGTIAVSALDRARLSVRIANSALQTGRAALAVRQSELATAEAALIDPLTSGDEASCCIALKAPVDGRVLRLLQESEQVVIAGTPLIEVGDPENLEIVVDLLSSDAVRVKVGAVAEIVGWGGNSHLAAVVRRIEPFGFTKISTLGIEEQRVNLIIDFTGPSTDRARLGHGYKIDARIRLWLGEDVVKVPVAALFRENNDWAVFVANDGIARIARVGIGHRNSREAEVVSGLEPGAQVVLHPSDRIADLVKIEPRQDALR